MIRVRKLNGTLEEYNEEKLRNSLKNAGATEKTIDVVISKLQKILVDGIETKRLYDFVLKEYKKHQPHLSARYTLKSAILRLGPEGFAFEEFIGYIFQARGYSVELNQIVKGKNIEHEIDVIAEREGERLLIECKHHAKPWIGSPIQTALYVYARFLDVKEQFTRPLLVTNTRFSKQSVEYAKGVEMHLMGWKYPRKDSLERNIEQFRLYPVTMLHSLSKHAIKALLDNKVVLVKTLAGMTPHDLSEKALIPLPKAKKVLKEAQALCHFN